MAERVDGKLVGAFIRAVKLGIACPSTEGSGMTDRPYNVLFLTTGNSARSIIAEAILNKIGAGKFRGYSAGSQPKGQVHPETLQLLASLGYDTAGLRSKSLVEFVKEPQFDFVLTVCDDVASEASPICPGRPTNGSLGHR
jgi:protein-tyrosine-phosphatase